MFHPFGHKDGGGRLPKGSWRLVSPADFARAHVLDLAIALTVLVALVVGTLCFNAYLDTMFFSEGTSFLSKTYTQVASTFELFASRNWNVLETWENSLEYAPADVDVKQTWSYQAEQQQAWHYSDFYLFNADNDFVTASGRAGTADSIAAVFDEMYESGSRVASSYISSEGKRKIVFAKPLGETVEIDGVAYTGVAISYDNEYVEGLVTSDIYTGQSDCYMVDQNGDVVFSLAPKTVIADYVDNAPNYLRDHASFSRGSYEGLYDAIATSQRGSALISYDGSKCYVVTQPADVFGWSVVAIVKAEAVDEIPNKVRVLTIVVNAIFTVALFAGTLTILALRYRRHISKEIEGRKDAEHKSALNRQLLNGMTEIADRYSIVDLESGTYLYHECQLGKPLYPEEGRYEDLLEKLTSRYSVLTDTDDAKMSRLLNEDALRERLKSEADRIKFEYASRTEHVYMLMTVVPLFFNEDGQLARALLIVQDIGLRKELESAANTDDLTGLFNERYFANVLHIKQRKRIPFTLFYLDLDKFKPVNDTYGHDMGDKLLRQVSERLRSCVRTEDFAFRIGGDEFALIITGGLDDEAAERMKKRVQQKVSAPYRIDGVDITIGASCGYAAWPSEAGTAYEARLLADKRMYESKTRHHGEYGTTR